MSHSITGRLFVWMLLGIAVVILSVPIYVRAGPANDMCNPWNPCPCGEVPVRGGCGGGGGPQANTHNCPLYCKETVNGGTTLGHCTAPNFCHGDKFTPSAGQAGGSTGMQQLMQAMKGLMDALKGGGGGGGGSGGGSGGAAGCSTFRETTIQNNPDPCTYYVPTASLPTDNLTVPGLQNSGCTTYTPTSVVNDPNPCSYYVPSGLGTSTPATTTVNVTVNAPGQGFFSTLLNAIIGLSGSGGNIEVTDTGATIYAGNSDLKTNTSVVGFYGSNSGQPLGIVGRLCASRPWAHSFLSFLIPPSFFDNLCSLRGYQVGPTPPTPAAHQVATPQLVQPAPQPQLSTTTVHYVPPQADIWAVPGSVPIGARTSIFWNSRGVNSCITTSPDGSFNETSLSGGASTVPIVGATVFTISCLAPDGSHVTNMVTVRLKI